MAKNDVRIHSDTITLNIYIECAHCKVNNVDNNTHNHRNFDNEAFCEGMIGVYAE